MAYLIDGHNLIGRIPDLRLDDPNDEAKLVERLKRFASRTGKRCVVVFDRGLPGGLSRGLSSGGVQVVFAHGGTTADAIILERIHDARDPGQWVVVSADREIVEEAARRRMRVMPPGEFAAALDAPAAVPDDADPNPRVSPEDVEKWLWEFGVKPDDEA
ncbi:MAG: NYN domain-containing protein [Anaerolineae bacterium]|nr:NYN domain-containing protein [Anaerolineae bacterium]